jgi:RNA polymerase sigma factor (sigma-70 family)
MTSPARDLTTQYAWMIRMCRRRHCPRDVAREIVQEAYLRLFDYQRTSRVRDASALLRRIVINLSINYYHREVPRRRIIHGLDNLDRRGLLIDPMPHPERTLEAQQALDRVVTFLKAESERVCQVFLAQSLGYSHEEVGIAFGIMPRTVERHVVSAHRVLRESGERP